MGRLAPIHPGEILREEFLLPLGLRPEELAPGLGLSLERLGPLLEERVPLSADLALRLGHYFDTTPEFWLNLQQRYDLERAKDELDGELDGPGSWNDGSSV